MHESQNDFGDGMVMFGGEDLYYVPEDELEGFLSKFSAWKSYVYDFFNDLIDQHIKLNAQKYFKDATKISYLDTVTLHISNIDGLSLFTNGDFGIL